MCSAFGAVQDHTKTDKCPSLFANIKTSTRLSAEHIALDFSSSILNMILSAQTNADVWTDLRSQLLSNMNVYEQVDAGDWPLRLPTSLTVNRPSGSGVESSIPNTVPRGALVMLALVQDQIAVRRLAESEIKEDAQETSAQVSSVGAANVARPCPPNTSEDRFAEHEDPDDSEDEIAYTPATSAASSPASGTPKIVEWMDVIAKLGDLAKICTNITQSLFPGRIRTWNQMIDATTRSLNAHHRSLKENPHSGTRADIATITRDFSRARKLQGVLRSTQILKHAMTDIPLTANINKPELVALQTALAGLDKGPIDCSKLQRLESMCLLNSTGEAEQECSRVRDIIKSIAKAETLDAVKDGVFGYKSKPEQWLRHRDCELASEIAIEKRACNATKALLLAGDSINTAAQTKIPVCQPTRGEDVNFLVGLVEAKDHLRNTTLNLINEYLSSHGVDVPEGSATNLGSLREHLAKCLDSSPSEGHLFLSAPLMLARRTIDEVWPSIQARHQRAVEDAYDSAKLQDISARLSSMDEAAPGDATVQYLRNALDAFTVRKASMMDTISSMSLDESKWSKPTKSDKRKRKVKADKSDVNLADIHTINQLLRAVDKYANRFGEEINEKSDTACVADSDDELLAPVRSAARTSRRLLAEYAASPILIDDDARSDGARLLESIRNYDDVESIAHKVLNECMNLPDDDSISFSACMGIVRQMHDSATDPNTHRFSGAVIDLCESVVEEQADARRAKLRKLVQSVFSDDTLAPITAQNPGLERERNFVELVNGIKRGYAKTRQELLQAVDEEDALGAKGEMQGVATPQVDRDDGETEYPVLRLAGWRGGIRGPRDLDALVETIRATGNKLEALEFP